MIEFLSLTIENFLSVGKAKINLKEQGLVLIEGVNEDDPTAMSNGAGKSSILDALSWCLYGVTARGVTGDAVVNIKAGKGTRVSALVMIDGQGYLIERHRKHKTEKNRVTLTQIEDAQEANDLTAGTDKLTQHRIDALLGCSADVFNASIYMGQENMPDLPGMTDKALKAVLEEAMSLDKLDDALQIAKDRLATAEYALQDAERKDDQLLVKIDHAVSEKDNIKKQIGYLKTELVDLDDKVSAIKKELRDTDMHYSNAIDAAESQLAKLPDLDYEASRKAAQDTASAKYDARLQAISDKIVEINRRYEAMFADLRAAQTSLAGTVAGDAKCSMCGRDFDHDAEHAKWVADTKAKIDDLTPKVKALAAARQTLFDKSLILSDERQALVNDLLKEAHMQMTERQVVERQLAHLKTVHASELRRGNETLETYQKWSKQKADKIIDLQSDYAEFEATHRALRTERATHLASIPSLQARVRVMQQVRDVLGRKGFRGEVLDQITPYLNARTQHYLTQLTDDNITANWVTLKENSSGEYVEDFHIDVTHKSGVDRFASLSGGEKRKVRMACAMALQDLVGTRAIKPIKLFVADEIDDALDVAGLELLMGVLEEKAREVGTVLVISHNDLSDWVRQKITVRKKDGQSTID